MCCVCILHSQIDRQPETSSRGGALGPCSDRSVCLSSSLENCTTLYLFSINSDSFDQRWVTPRFFPVTLLSKNNDPFSFHSSPLPSMDNITSQTLTEEHDTAKQTLPLTIQRQPPPPRSLSITPRSPVVCTLTIVFNKQRKRKVDAVPNHLLAPSGRLSVVVIDDVHPTFIDALSKSTSTSQLLPYRWS